MKEETRHANEGELIKVVGNPGDGHNVPIGTIVRVKTAYEDHWVDVECIDDGTEPKWNGECLRPSQYVVLIDETKISNISFDELYSKL
jgi:hypothetical protein